MKTRCIVLFAAVVSLFIWTTGLAADAADAASAGAYPLVRQTSSDVRLIQFSPDVAVEQLTGKAAYAHLQNLLSRRPHALARSRARLVERGFKPTDAVFVERTLRRVSHKRQSQNPDYSLVQTSGEYSQEGEILFWSYDGPGYTWQGTIYLNVYGQGEATWDGQLDTDSYDYPWNWVYNTWSECPEGECGESDEDAGLRLTPPKPGAAFHYAKELLRRDASNAYQRTALARLEDWAHCWRQNVIGGCTAAATVCWRVKAAFPACWAAACVGVEIGYGIGCAIR